MDKLKEISTWKIRRIANIISTTTQVVIESNTNVTNKTPPNPLVASTERLRDIPDDTFEKLIESTMKAYFDSTQINVEGIIKTTGMNEDLVQSAIIFLRGLIWNNLAGDLSIDSFQRILLDDYKYPQTKIDIVTRHFERNKNELRFTLMFSLVKNLSNKLEATSKSLEYMKVIASNLEELKGLYGHVLDVCVSTKGRRD